jgi:hypothetical protein
MRRSLLLFGVLAACAVAGLALHAPGAEALPPERKAWFVALLAVAAVAWAVVVRDILRGVLRARAVWVGLAVALGLRAMLVPVVVPFLSSDAYRYVWDGRVQAAGVNPYLYVPADKELAFLRDGDIYPHINRASSAPTIYAPFAQLVFAASARFAPGIVGIKLVMVGFEILAMASVWLLVGPARVLIYALNPLPLWAFAGNGHVDALAIGMIALAMLLAMRRWPWAAGVAFAAAVLTKFLPVVVFPALWRRAWGLPVGAALAVLALYGLYADAGARVLGFLPGYAPDEGLTTGEGFWLLAGVARLGALPGLAAPAYAAAVALGLAALGVRILRRPGMMGADAALLAAALTVGISPHYPWYFAWLGLFAVLHPAPWLLWLSASPVLLYLNPFGDQFVWPCLVYLPAAALALAGLRPRSKLLAGFST